MEAVAGCGDDPEGAAPAPQRPVQVAIASCRRPPPAPVSEDDLGLDEIVESQPVLAVERAVPARQGQADHAHRLNRPRDRSQPVAAGRSNHVAGAGAALGHGRAGAGSTVTARMADRSSTMPPSVRARPAQS